MPKTDNTDVPTCPHCGRRHFDYWEWGWSREEYRDGGEKPVECKACGKPFTVTLHIRHEFSTRKGSAG